MQPPPMTTTTSDVISAVNVLHVHTWRKHQLRPMPFHLDANESGKHQHLRVFPLPMHCQQRRMYRYRCQHHRPLTTSCDHLPVLNCDANAVGAVRLATLQFDWTISCECFRMGIGHSMLGSWLAIDSKNCCGLMCPTLEPFGVRNAHLAVIARFSV